ncbi:MAG: 6-hydroxypseudooxynicotine dehydrogenase complex subunit alpha [Anaerolineae bacterium]|nr:6-hydroxypseudooxynicotine dehydrogenase complex subunit alpha [Anaerolineae bacterium]
MLNLQTIYKPTTLAEALRLAREPDTALMAGGVALISEKRRDVRAAIDLSALALAFIETRANDLVIGATTTLAEIVDSDLARGVADGVLVQAAQQSHASVLRNQASAAGTIIAEPGEIFAVALLALDARLTLAALKDSRVENSDLSLADFFAQRAMRLPHSIVTAITIPASARSRRAQIETVARTPRDRAIVAVGAALEMERGVVRAAALALGGVAETAWRAQDAEREILNQALTEEIIQRAALAAANGLNPRGDFRGSAEYRIEMARVLTARALRGLRA